MRPVALLAVAVMVWAATAGPAESVTREVVTGRPHIIPPGVMARGPAGPS